MHDPEPQRLEPTPFAPSQADSQALAKPASREARTTAVPIWLALGFAGIALLFVIFVLPELVTPAPNQSSVEPVTETDATTRPLATAQSQATDLGVAQTPFAQAQEQERRQAAQQVLEALLDQQRVLKNHNVERWAEPAYEAALGTAAAGDTAYRDRDFEGAAVAYQSALDALSALSESLPERVATAIDALDRDIENLSLAEAQRSLDWLGALNAADVDLLSWQARVDALPLVIAALDEGQEAVTRREFDSAVAAASRAIGADPEHQRAQVLRQNWQALALDAAFSQAMSEGYAALDAEQFDRAARQFEAAQRLRPNAPETTAALVELSTSRTAAELRELTAAGRDKIAEEDWAGALEAFNAALAIDDTLVFAQIGVEQATPRLQLDLAIEGILAQPERLVDPRILSDARSTLRSARAIEQVGPRLSSQIVALEKTLAYASTPITVTLTSDGLTDITVLRAQRLGLFATQTISLRPGEYTAVGFRNGFRDVRITFLVSADGPNNVDIRCEEAL